MLVPFTLAVLASGACQTVIDGAKPPIAVRSTPTGPSVAMLAEGTPLTLAAAGATDGWLQIAGPTPGYVQLSSTKVDCGAGRPIDVVDRISALGQDAAANPASLDTLVRLVGRKHEENEDYVAAETLAHLASTNGDRVLSGIAPYPHRFRVDVMMKLASALFDYQTFGDSVAKSSDPTLAEDWRHALKSASLH